MENKKLKIAVDIDEVLCETARSFLKVVEMRKGIKKKFEDIYSYDIWDVFGIEREEADEFFQDTFPRESYCKLEFVEGSIEGVNKIKDIHDLFFVTARPVKNAEDTQRYISNNFVSSPKVYFSGDAHEGQGKSKIEICNELGINLIIEDNKEFSLNCAEGGLRVLLLDKPWNQDCEHENITRCNNWGEILERIQEVQNGE